ncbi:MAG: hypothetical protein ABIR71_02380 [Chthoniobacterales bacterium]
MNNDEAKFILSAYRPAGDDAGDPRFGEAIAQAERDPELSAWFQAERRFDSEMSAALETVPLPAALRATILAGGKISRPHVWSGRRTILALAASLLLLAALAGVWWPRAPQLDFWQRDALALVPKLGTKAMRFDLENEDGAVLRNWLEQREAPAPGVIPVALQKMPALGCKTIRTQGQEVSILCFQLSSGKLIHLVVTEQGTLRHPPTNKPRFVDAEGWKTASWSAHGRAYMLATKASESELRATLPQNI